jgi:hypothetical protein
VALLFKTGAQLPIMPLMELTGKADKADPEQMGATEVKVGLMVGLTVMV